MELAHKIRLEIKDATGCPASVGISYNVLLARMCTRDAKPNGQFYLPCNPPEAVQRFIGKFISFLADKRLRTVYGMVVCRGH